MKGYSISMIQQWLQADCLQLQDADAVIDTLLTDSRHIATPAVSLFFALKGPRRDGHDHIQEAYYAGVRNFIVGKAIDLSALPEANILRTTDTLAALQTVARKHREQFNLPVIGITGSNGKTIVKEWLFQLLQPDYAVVRSPKSYNSQIGVPLSVWQIQAQHQIAILEAGISQPEEMDRLERIIQPTLGIFTNIGPAHREGFSSKQQKVYEKMRLFARCRTLVYCADHPRINEAAREWQSENAGRQTWSWSAKGLPADVQISPLEQPSDRYAFRIEWTDKQGRQQNESFELPFNDAVSIENAMHCIVTALLLDLPTTHIRERLSRLEPVAMRLEIKAAVRGCMLINDAYNNDLVSLRMALRFAARQTRSNNNILILSDMLQTGLDSEVLYAQMAAELKELTFQLFIGIGREIPQIQRHLPPGIEARFFQDTDAFLDDPMIGRFTESLILLKGARPFAFERIAARLEQKAHKTVLEVNLSALAHNLNVYNRLLAPSVKMMVMVKAAAYGSGSAEVAKLLEFQKVDYLSVAYPDEGVELRHAGIRLPIMVLNTDPGSFDVLHRYRLEPEVYSLDHLNDVIRFCKGRKSMDIHLKLDTGMRRLGFEATDIESLVQHLLQNPNLRVQSIFSHLAASDAPIHDGFTQQQAQRFLAMYHAVTTQIGYFPLRHIVNTGGITRFPEYHFDMVRLGIGLYGVAAGGLAEQLRVVHVLKATISQIKEVTRGETVGYNRKGKVEKNSRIATISIGYADGFLRLAGNGAFAVYIHGKLAPTIGNVCMDMTMIDISDIPEAREGDAVEIFGENLSVKSLSDALQTIPYEIFTNISERVKRVYWQES